MIRQYSNVLAVAAFVGALLFCRLLAPLTHGYPALAIFVGAVALIAWLGGIAPGLLSAILGYVACEFWFSTPQEADLGMTVLGIALYGLLSVAAIGFGTALQWRGRELRRQRRQRDEQAERELLAAAALRLEKQRIEQALQSATRVHPAFLARSGANDKSNKIADLDPALLISHGPAVQGAPHFGDTLPHRSG